MTMATGLIAKGYRISPEVVISAVDVHTLCVRRIWFAAPLNYRLACLSTVHFD